LNELKGIKEIQQNW